MKKLVLAGAALFALCGAPVLAASNEDYKACGARTMEEYDEMITFCTRAIESGDYDGHDLAWLYVQRAFKFDTQNNGERTLADLSKAIESDPEYFRAYARRGNTYYHYLGDYDRALADYDRAIQIDPNDDDAWQAFNGRGNVYAHKGDFDRAIAAHSRAIKLTPGAVYPPINRGEAYLLKGDYDHAIQDFSDIIRRPELAPRVVNWTRLSRGAAYFNTGNYERAAADFDAVQSQNPRITAAALYGRGIVKLKKGDTAGGNADVTSAKAIKSDVAEQWPFDTHTKPDDMTGT